MPHHSRATLLLTATMLVACSDNHDASPTTQSLGDIRTLQLAVDKVEGSAVALAPKAATLTLGTGIILKAQVRDGAGQLVTDARATWRSTNAAVAIVTALADSGLVSDRGRAVVSSIASGSAMIIAQYESVADTAVITIVPRVDTATPPRPPVQRPVVFDLAIRVQGVLATNAAGDSASRHEPLAGATVTVTLLPPAPGDTVVTASPITSPTVVGVFTTDASGIARVSGIAASRYRVRVQPAAGTSWQGTTSEYAAPYAASMQHDIWLRRP